MVRPSEEASSPLTAARQQAAQQQRSSEQSTLVTEDPICARCCGCRTVAGHGGPRRWHFAGSLHPGHKAKSHQAKHKAKKGWLATCRDAMQLRIPTITRSPCKHSSGMVIREITSILQRGMRNHISPIAPNSGTSTLGTPLPCTASSVVRQGKAGARAGTPAGCSRDTGRNRGPLANGAWSCPKGELNKSASLARIRP